MEELQDCYFKVLQDLQENERDARELLTLQNTTVYDAIRLFRQKNIQTLQMLDSALTAYEKDGGLKSDHKYVEWVESLKRKVTLLLEITEI